jgi:cyclopropane fatty-acyl-phospholipid synthase-like methyltransferase
MKRWSFAALGICSMLLLSTYAQDSAKPKPKGEKAKYDDPTYLPTPDNVIAKMFEMGKIKKDDIIFDLGCGDGRILYMAAEKFGCRGIGLELNPERIREAMDQAVKYKDTVGTRVEIRFGDALKVKDISDATVVVMYMFPEFMDLWYPIAKEKLKPGTRILSHDYCFAKNEWEPDAMVEMPGPHGTHKVYLWTVKKNEKK